MKWLAILLVILLATLVGVDRWMTAATHLEREVFAAVRDFPPGRPIDPEEVVSVEVGAGSGRWRYVLRDSVWYHPAMHDAYANGDAIRRMLRSTLTSTATIVSDEGPSGYHGLGPNGVTLRVGDDRLFEIGARLPGVTVPERYIREAGSDTVYQLHADPWAPVGDLEIGTSLLDPRIIPVALSRRSIREVVIARPGEHIRLERVDVETTTPGPEGPRYTWYREVGARRDSVNLSAAWAYVGYLQGLTWNSVLDPGHAGKGKFLGSVMLLDDTGQRDSIDLRRDDNGTIIASHRGTGRVYGLEDEQVDLVFTSMDLRDPLPDPNPFRVH